MRVAATDLGSNSTRLLVCEVSGGRIVREIASHSIVTRMGEGVDAEGVIGDAAIARVTNVLTGYRAVMDRCGVETGLALLTSAARDADNGRQLAEIVSEVLDIDARLISGDEEARLVYLGATFDRAPGAATVLDIGGGSTEIAFGDGDALDWHASSQVGVVRHTERFLHSDPPSAEQIAAMRGDIRARLGELTGGRTTPLTLSVGGTPVSCATMLGHDRAHGARVSARQCEQLLERVVGMSQEELRQVQGLHPARAPAIVAGISIHLEAMHVLGATEFEVCEHDLRHGAVVELAVAAGA